MKEYLIKRREYADKKCLEYWGKYADAERQCDYSRHLFASEYASWSGRLYEIDLMLKQLELEVA